MGWSAQDIPDQSGRVVVITGANSGLGLETARALAGAGARVIAACRSEEKARAAIEDIESEDPPGSVEFSVLDLSSLDSVESFAAELSKKLDHLDLLINNAGVMAPPLQHTADGFELQFGTNHLGHFALTALLAELLVNTPAARIVTVSSIAHKLGKIDFDNLNCEQKYRKWKAYGVSKLSNLLFTLELSQKLATANAEAIAVAAHPGYTNTNLQQETIGRIFNPLVAMSPARGALPSLYAATAEDVENNGYYGPGGLGEIWGSPKPAKRNKRAQDAEVASQLWEVSEQMTGVAFEI